MFKNLLIILTVLIFSSVGFAQNKSVYSNLTAETCKDATPADGKGLFYLGKCKGVGGYDLDYHSDDDRSSLSVVFPSKKIVALNFWNYFRYFSMLGEKAEWRMKGNKPTALIVLVNSTENGTKEKSYLVVAKIADETACVTDVVNPSKTQNATARKLADTASTRKCMAEFAETDSAESKGSSDKPRPVLINEFAFGNDEVLWAQLDNFFNELRNTPNATGGITITGKKASRTKAEKQIKDYAKRMFDSALIEYASEEDNNPTTIKLWITSPDTAADEDSSEKPQAILHDEFPFSNAEDLMARFDNFSVMLQNEPAAKGYIVVNGSKTSRTKTEKQIKDYVKQRMFDSSRLEYVDEDGKDAKTMIEFWIVPPGTFVPER